MNIKRCFLNLVLLAIGTLVVSTMFFSCQSQNNEITIKGTVEFPYEDHKIKISHIVDGAWSVVDSITVNADKTFEKTITLPMPGVYEIDCQQWERLNFWGENEDIEINFRGVDTATVKNILPPYRHVEQAGENNELLNLVRYSDYRTSKSRYITRMNLMEAEESDCDEWKEHAAEAYREAYIEGSDNVDYLAKQYRDRNSVVALLPRIRNKEIKADVLDYLDQNKPDYPPYVAYKEKVAEKEEKMKKVAAGVTAPDFSYIYKDGKQGENLEDFKGKYLLIDFWASWCAPCRKSIPVLKELYEEYGSEEFEILSVSIDGEKESWLKALDEENMLWPQVFTEDTGKEVMAEFLFSSIPHLVLIDKDGKFMKRGILVDELKKTLSEIFVK